MLYAHTLGRAVRYYPDRAAFVDVDRRLSFAELAARVDRLAAELVVRGFLPGDRLALLLPNCLEYIELVYACCRLGVIVVPLNVRYAVPEIDEVLRDSTPKGLLRHSSLPRPTATVAWEVVLDQQPLAGNEAAPPEPFYGPEAIFGLFYTSGTTGRAKGVMLTHANLLANMHHSTRLLGIHGDSVWMHTAPMFHLADFPAILNSPAEGGGQACIPRFEPRAFCEAVQAMRVTHTILIPTMVNFLTQFEELDRYDLSSLELITYGGSPIAPEIIKRTREKLPHVKLAQGYGLTEAAPLLTRLADEDHTAGRILSCGQPCAGVELEIVDEQGRPVPAGQRGEIAARGANIMKGYWNKPEETARAIVDGWLRTGDVAWQDEGGFVYIVDRAKDMIVTGGENVYSTEVEAVVYDHPAVKEAAVIGIPDPQWGELVTVCVVVKDGATLAPEELTAHCRARLANYKIPRRIEFIAGELPKSGTGKILKRALREPYWKDAGRAVG